ncbi:MAG: hypothetical protein IMY67_12175 [Bacteroidetes bacterium]|nr:hypothetical protein [Bacteroidota bacterium]
MEEISLVDMNSERPSYESVSYVNNPSFNPTTNISESTFTENSSVYNPIYNPMYNTPGRNNPTRENISSISNINKLKVSIILGLIILGIAAIALLSYYLTLTKENNPTPSPTVRPSFSPFTMFPTSQATTTTQAISTTAQQGDKDCLEYLVPEDCCWGEPVRNHCV